MNRQLSEVIKHWNYISPVVGEPKTKKQYELLLKQWEQLVELIGDDENHKLVVLLDESEEIMSFDEFHERCANEWVFPDKYKQIDVKTWLLEKCNTQQEIDRVEEEYRLYLDRDLIMLLRLFIFIVDYMRENKFIRGVGRGSSVSSYILYLIGIHRVDSIKYGLDIKEYLR